MEGHVAQESANAVQDRSSPAASHMAPDANVISSSTDVGGTTQSIGEPPEVHCAEDAFRQVETANNSLTGLETRHASLLESLDDGTFDTQMPRSALEADRLDLEHLHRYQDARLADISIEYRPTNVSAVSARQVFDTPELFEQIALFLEPRDALSVVQITKNSISIFEDSPKLQAKLSLHRAEDGFLFNPFEDFESSISFAEFQVDIKTIDEHPAWDDDETAQKRNHRVTVEAGFSPFAHLPKIGTRCRSMLICQPPVKVMQVTLDCCGNVRYLEPMSRVPRFWATNVDQEPHSEEYYRATDQDKHLDDESIENNNAVKSLEIKSKTGITVGDVYDASLAIRNAHALCPHAAADVHDDDGQVRPDVCFHSEITLKNDDPYVQAEALAKEKVSLNEIIENGDRQAFAVYIRAKKTAWKNGWTIPTYEAFKSKHP